MIEVKTVELRDRATCMPCIALRVTGDDPVLRRAGFGMEGQVVFIDLTKPDVEWDPYSWGTMARTVPMAHEWLRTHWEEHVDGAVVDVEYIAGETTKPKEPELV